MAMHELTDARNLRRSPRRKRVDALIGELKDKIGVDAIDSDNLEAITAFDWRRDRRLSRASCYGLVRRTQSAGQPRMQ